MSLLMDKFYNQASKVNFKKSAKEELERYDGIAYSNRIVKWITEIQRIKELAVKNNT